MTRNTWFTLALVLAFSFGLMACATPDRKDTLSLDDKGNPTKIVTTETEKTVTPSSVKLSHLPEGGWKLEANAAKHTNLWFYGAPGSFVNPRSVERQPHGVYLFTDADVKAGRDRGNFKRAAAWTRARFSDEWGLPANSTDHVGVGALKNDKEHSYVLFGLYYKPDDPASMAKFNALVTECGLDPATEATKLDAAWAPPPEPEPPAEPTPPAPPSGGGA